MQVNSLPNFLYLFEYSTMHTVSQMSGRSFQGISPILSPLLKFRIAIYSDRRPVRKLEDHSLSAGWPQLLTQ